MNEQWALPAPDDAFGSFVTDAFRTAGLDYPHPTVITSALEIRANLLRTGRYLSIIPEFWLQLPRPASLPQETASRVADCGRADWHRHFERSQTEPGRSALHRLRPRRREVTAEMNRLPLTALRPGPHFQRPKSRCGNPACPCLLAPTAN